MFLKTLFLPIIVFLNYQPQCSNPSLSTPSLGLSPLKESASSHRSFRNLKELDLLTHQIQSPSASKFHLLQETLPKTQETRSILFPDSASGSLFSQVLSSYLQVIYTISHIPFRKMEDSESSLLSHSTSTVLMHPGYLTSTDG